MQSDPPTERVNVDQIRREAHQVAMLAVSYACPLLIAEPPAIATSVRTGSAVVVIYGNQYYLITAAHLLTKTRDLQADGKAVEWHLASDTTSESFDPEHRLAYFDAQQDLVVLTISAKEAVATGKLIYNPPEWPPSPPIVGEYLFFTGFPASERIQVAERYWSFAPACIGGAVDSSGDGRFAIRFERERWLTYQPGVEPTLGDKLGGMSGGPIFSPRGIMLQLVGVVTEHTSGLDIMRAASLERTLYP